MLVRINRGPNFGQEVHMPVSQELNLAILLGDVEVVEQKPAASAPPAASNPHAPCFFIGKGLQSGKIQLRMNIGAEEHFYTGPVEHAATAFGGGLRTPPADVIAKYEAALKGRHDPILEMCKREDSKSLDPNVATNPRR